MSNVKKKTEVKKPNVKWGERGSCQNPGSCQKKPEVKWELSNGKNREGEWGKERKKDTHTHTHAQEVKFKMLFIF